MSMKSETTRHVMMENALRIAIDAGKQLLDGNVEQAAAKVVFDAAPMPLQQVEIVQLAQGRQQSRAIIRRSDIQRTARIDQMFDGLEASGFAVESLEISRGEVRVQLSSAHGGDEADVKADYESAARLVAEYAPAEVSTAGRRTEPPTMSDSSPSRTRSRSTTSTRRSFINWVSTTRR